MNTLEAVNFYKNQNMAVIPVQFQGKNPIISEWQGRVPEDTRLEEFEGQFNIGVVLGENSNGLIDVDLDYPSAVDLAPHFLPDTGVIFGRCGNQKSHYLYKVENPGKTRRFQFTDMGSIAEVRANGAQTVFPPSIHPTGEQYAFYKNEIIGETTQQKLECCVAKMSAAILLIENWEEGQRHDMALALAGGLLNSDKWSLSEVKKFIEIICSHADDNDLDDRLQCAQDTQDAIHEGLDHTGWPKLGGLIGREITQKVIEWTVGKERSRIGHNSANAIPAKPEVSEELLTDMGNGELFADQHGDKAIYIEDMGYWGIWDGKKWEMKKPTALRKLAHKTAESLFRSFTDVVDSGLRDKIFKHAKRSSGTQRLDAMIKEAQPYMAIQSEMLDQQQMLFNCQNGVIDLGTGELKAHNPELLLTQCSDVAYKPDAECPLFQKFLNEIFEENENIISYVQRALGYTLTGSTKEQCFFVAWGEGANGKSTLLEIIDKIIGQDYASTSPMKTLMAKESASGSSDLARLRGVRYVKASEGEANQYLSEAMIKRFTGGEKITACFKFKEYFEFIPTGKIWMGTNHKPRITGDDQAIWRRVHLIPFNVTIPAEKRDKDLPKKLWEEREGILAWLVEGAKQWAESGLMPPEQVLQAVEEYRHEMDTLGQFLAECVQTAPERKVTKTQMYEKYTMWCSENGCHPYNKKNFGKKLMSRGYEDGRQGSMGWYWKNIIIG